jgi:dienelactone hydrolase
MTERVAAAGYFGVTPDLYHRDGSDCTDPGPTRRTRLRDTNIISDVNATAGFLKSHRLVNAGRVGIVGFCGRPGGLPDGGGGPEFQRRGHLLWRQYF